MIFYNLCIYPLELLVDFFFVFFHESFENIGVSILGISIVINMLSLPLYNEAELLQRKERDLRMQMAPGINRIKQAFKGDEQYMILSTYYRQNHYHPVYALRSSVSLMIQVPFFIAAYHYLSNLPQLQGVRFLGIPDLGQPDAMLAIGGLKVNLLPILMTLINVIAGAVYTKGLPLRDKLQLYGMALLFMVLLYTSPSGLVLYWTCNNLFSLAKNLFYRLKHPLKVLYVICASSVSILAITILILHPWAPLIKRLLVLVAALGVCLIPTILGIFSKVYHHYLAGAFRNNTERNQIFLLSIVLLWVLQGLVVPALLIQSSPTEFSYLGVVNHPLAFLIDTATKYAGLYLVWVLLLYVISHEAIRDVLALVFPPLTIIALMNMLVFSGHYGYISPILLFDNPGLLNPSMVLNLSSIACAVCILIIYFFIAITHRAGVVRHILSILILGTILTSGVFAAKIHNEYIRHTETLKELEQQEMLRKGTADYSLSKQGKNVVFVFLDRAIGSYAELFFQEFPEMRETFRGFIYYPNTVSYGTNTANGSPALFAGYEYTPENLNARENEKMVDKHNEALLVLPRMFSQSGYAVTVTDPPYSNYRLVGDYRPFQPYPEISVKQLIGKQTVRYKQEHADVLKWEPSATSDLLKARLPVFSLLRTALPIMREAIYDNGGYLHMRETAQDTDDFLNSYSQLYYLHDLTDYDAPTNTFTVLSNETPHEPVLLEAPLYEPRDELSHIHNPLQSILHTVSQTDLGTYHANVATLLQLAKWFEHLKEEGVYDNTRIILVSDHGHPVQTHIFQDFSENALRYALFNPLLMVKDFNASGVLQEKGCFMTNADAAIIALEGLGIPMINPFSGEDMKSWIKKDVVSVVQGGGANYTGNQIRINFEESYTIKDDIRVESNWGPLNP
nr:YidC/Oxa1 family membrane protein insertase [uncultured Sphaerochaeta sp.]